MHSHEYTIAGHNRAEVGRWLYWGALCLAGAAAWALVEMASFSQHFGINKAWADKVIPLATAGAFFPLGLFYINYWGWKARLVRKFLGLPDLNGTWTCAGATLDQDGGAKYEWHATVEISQTWEKIFVRLKTDQSESESITAAVIKLPTGDFKLIYTYRNVPRLGEPDLHQHSGCCELEFDSAENTAHGEYFNNRGRVTYGRMTLTRKG
jgi:hypothetical protein